MPYPGLCLNVLAAQLTWIDRETKSGSWDHAWQQDVKVRITSAGLRLVTHEPHDLEHDS